MWRKYGRKNFPEYSFQTANARTNFDRKTKEETLNKAGQESHNMKSYFQEELRTKW